MAERQSNIELLRILAMFFIVLSHIPIFVGIDCYAHFGCSLEEYLVRFIRTLGRVGTNVFVIITGYFSIMSTFKLSSLLKLWCITFFYSISILIIFLLCGTKVNIQDIIKNIFPISFGQYWFVSCYFCLYLISPLLVNALKNLTKQQYLYFLKTIIFCWSIWYTLLIYPSNPIGLNYNLFFWFIILFSIGGYIRLHINPKNINKNICFMYIYLSIICYAWYLTIINSLNIDMNPYLDRNNFFILVFSICLFLLFVKMKNTTIKLINKISVCTIGIYLIHENPYVRNFEYTYLQEHINKNPEYLITKILIAAILIFVICLIIEYFRRTISKKYSMQMCEFLKKYDILIKEIINRQ